MSSGAARRRRWLQGAELLAVLCVLALPILDVAIGGRFWWITALTTFHFYWLLLLGGPGLLLLAFRAGRRHWPLALAALGAAVLYGPQMVPSAGSGDESAEPLTILSWNVQASRGDPANLESVILDVDPDVVALQEVISPELAEEGLLARLRRAGFECEYRAYFEEHRNTGIGLCVRPPVRVLQAARRTYHEAGRWSYLFGEIASGERVVNLVVPHFLAFGIREEDVLRSTATIVERVRETTVWHRQEVAALLDLLDRVRDPTFLVGDFNSTPWQATHVALRSRLDDAFAEGGLGLGATVRYFVPLRIDYVYVPSGTRVEASGRGPWASSDHRAVWARVDLATVPEP